MRILIAGETYAPSFNGQAMFTTRLAEGLAARGHQVCVVTPSEYGKPYQISRNGVQINTVKAIELKFLHQQAYASFLPDVEVRRIFKRFRPEILHLQDHYPMCKCTLRFARLYGIPAVGTNHFMPENLAPYVPVIPRFWPLFNGLLWWWMKRVFNRLDLATAPSRTAVEILKAQGVNVPLQPVSCGVNLQRFQPDQAVDRAAVRRKYGLHPHQTAFLFVGRVDAEKKVDVLIRAVKLLERNDIQLVVTGNGAALHTYQGLAAQLGVEDRLHFTGFVEERDLPLLLNSVDIFAMPSEAELLSIASLEAMATARPLLAARAKALPELVDEGNNGYLFAPGDVVDAARCMALLADHPERWPEMGAASLKKVQPHSLETVLGRYEELYARCLGVNKRP
jgi:1,2-diacylglycerol 3-alpha-glucosyltransferase